MTAAKAAVRVETCEMPVGDRGWAEDNVGESEEGVAMPANPIKEWAPVWIESGCWFVFIPGSVARLSTGEVMGVTSVENTLPSPPRYDIMLLRLLGMPE